MMAIIYKSFLAALVTAIILIMAKFLGPKLAGAIGGLPIVFVVSYVLLTLNNKQNSKDFLIGGVYGSIAAIFFSLILIWLNAQFLKSYWLNLIIAYIVCFFISIGFVYLLPIK